jgi:molybdopterin converting factor small subunit
MASLHLPELMKYYVDDQTDLVLDGNTVAEVIVDLVARYPSIKLHIMDKNGQLRRYINLFINHIDINELNGMDTPIQADDKIILLPSISGG